MVVNKVIFAVGLFLLFSCTVHAKTCSEQWGFDCSTGPPETGGDNTFDDCSNGDWGNERVTEIYLEKDSIFYGDTVNVTCEYHLFFDDDVHIWYYNGSGWRSLLFERRLSSKINRSVVFYPDNVTGTHWLRCSTDYGMNDLDGCSDMSYHDNDDISFTVKERQGELKAFNISLLKGWNLISSPLNFTNMTKIFEPIRPYFGVMVSYDGEDKEFTEIDPYNLEGQADLRYGVWLNVSQDTVLSISGDEFGNTSVELLPGWNLIGHTYLNGSLVNISPYNNSIIYGYNNSGWFSYIPSRKYNTLNYFVPGYGYWVNSR